MKLSMTVLTILVSVALFVLGGLTVMFGWWDGLKTAEGFALCGVGALVLAKITK